MRSVGEVFDVMDSVESALEGAAFESSTSQQRLQAWGAWGGPRNDAREFLVPRIERDIVRSTPPWWSRVLPLQDRQDEARLAAQAAALGPWLVPVQLAPGVTTMGAEELRYAVALERLLYRRELIVGTLALLLGEELGSCSVLDIGCQAGFFSLDLADRGAATVKGIDLRPENVAQARFLAGHFGSDRVSFDVADANQLDADDGWDVVLNLGVLYHVTDPFGFIRDTYERCRRVAVIDTSCLREPVSAFMVLGDRDVVKADEGRAPVELHPTYRAVIDTIRHAGFREIVEVVGRADPAHEWYEQGLRRCFLAVK